MGAGGLMRPPRCCGEPEQPLPQGARWWSAAKTSRASGERLEARWPPVSLSGRSAARTVRDSRGSGHRFGLVGRRGPGFGMLNGPGG